MSASESDESLRREPMRKGVALVPVAIAKVIRPCPSHGFRSADCSKCALASNPAVRNERTSLGDRCRRQRKKHTFGGTVQNAIRHCATHYVWQRDG